MIIKMALCEDCHYDQQEVLRYLAEWEAQSGHKVIVQTYPDSNKLIGDIDDSFAAFDTYLLDIEMQTPTDGLNLARAIRLHSDDIPIIFITNHIELALDGYDVHALHFIAKPIDKTRLFSTLDRLALILQRRKESHFTCKIGGQTKIIPLYEVVYLTSDDHYLLINGDRECRFRGKLSAIANDYSDIFVHCHQSYAVNIEHIRELIGTSLRLSNDAVVPVSKNNLPYVRRRIASFFSFA